MSHRHEYHGTGREQPLPALLCLLPLTLSLLPLQFPLLCLGLLFPSALFEPSPSLLLLFLHPLPLFFGDSLLLGNLPLLLQPLLLLVLLHHHPFAHGTDQQLTSVVRIREVFPLSSLPNGPLTHATPSYPVLCR
jgi:hypothetical protein